MKSPFDPGHRGVGKELDEVEKMRVFAEAEGTGRLIEITDTADGREVVAYAALMASYGLTEGEIEEDIGGGEYERDGKPVPFDGLIPWACEAVYRCGDIYLGDPGVYA